MKSAKEKKLDEDVLNSKYAQEQKAIEYLYSYVTNYLKEHGADKANISSNRLGIYLGTIEASPP